LEDKAFGRLATASSSQAGHDPSHAVDGHATPRWSTSTADGQWGQVDLGAARQVSGVQSDWDAAFASSYQILTSVDGVTFTPVAQTGAVGPGLQTDRFTERTARYVRVAAMQAATLAGVSF